MTPMSIPLFYLIPILAPATPTYQTTPMPISILILSFSHASIM